MNRTSRTEIVFLLALVVSACAVQCVVISRATVPALDAVRFVRSARMIGESGFLELARSAPDAPLFSLSVAAVHALLVGLVGDFREAWAFSAQIAAAAPLVLLLFPAYGLCRCLVGARSASCGVALLAFLPELVRIGGDGISDTTYLFFLSLAMWILAVVFTARAMGGRTGLPLVALAGAATGLAALVRIEAMVLAAACALVFAAGRFQPTSACHRRRFFSALAYGLGLAATAGLYALMIQFPPADPAPASGADTATGMVFESPAPRSSRLEIAIPGEEELCFAPKDPTVSIRRRGWASAPALVLEKLAKAFAYLPGVLAIAGLWSLRRRPPSAADRLLQVFTLLFLGAVFVHTAREGYLSPRHFLPLCVVATSCIGCGTEAAATALWRALGRVGNEVKLAAAIVVCVVAIFLVEGTRPVHRTRLGHRLAADWLARHASTAESVVDTQGLTGLYSGLRTAPYEEARAELGRDGLRYFVVEDQELQRASKRSRTLNLLLETAGQRAATFSAAEEPDRPAAGVSIYRWEAGRFRAAVVAQPTGAVHDDGPSHSAASTHEESTPRPGDLATCRVKNGGAPARD